MRIELKFEVLNFLPNCLDANRLRRFDFGRFTHRSTPRFVHDARIFMPDNEHPEVNSAPPSALKSFISGGIGGMCSTLVGHPIDLVKVRMQTMVVAKGQKVRRQRRIFNSSAIFSARGSHRMAPSLSFLFLFLILFPLSRRRTLTTPPSST